LDFLEDHKDKDSTDRQPLDVLAIELSTLANDQVTQKATIEARWVEDLRQYHGIYDTKTEQELKEKEQSRVFANITRPYCDGAEARFSEMMLPTDDRNWDCTNTPDPELVEKSTSEDPMFGPEGEYMYKAGQAEDEQEELLTHGYAATLEIEKASERAKKMRTTIDDQLTESNYPSKARDCVRDIVRLGTGVLEGPVEQIDQVKKWTKAQDINTQSVVRMLEMVSESKPVVRYVSPWDYFPDMSAATLEEADFEFERSYMTKRQVRKLLKNESYFKDQLKKLLGVGPEIYKTESTHLDEMRKINGLDSTKKDNRFEFWKYQGPVKKSVLCDCGLAEPDEEEPLNGDDEEEVEAVVIFCGAHVVKIHLPLLETDERSYCVANWIEDDSSIFGYGVPYSGRNSQAIFNAGWRMMIDNSALSIGPQTVANKQAIEPADGVWELTTKKIWLLKDKKIPINQVFHQFNIDSRTNEILLIIKEAKQLFEEETGLQMVVNNDQPKMAQESATAAKIRMNTSHVVIRRVVRQFDDGITMKLITGFYTYNMQYHEDDSIKGDYKVDARGSTVLLQKDAQAAALFGLASFVESPVFGPMMKARELLRKLVQSQSIQPDDVVLSDKEIDSNQEAMAEAAQQGDGGLAAEKLKLDYQIHQEKLEDRNFDRQARMYERQMDQQNLVLKLAQERGLTIEKINAELQKTSIIEKGKAERFYDEANLRLATGQGI